MIPFLINNPSVLYKNEYFLCCSSFSVIFHKFQGFKYSSNYFSNSTHHTVVYALCIPLSGNTEYKLQTVFAFEYYISCSKDCAHGNGISHTVTTGNNKPDLYRPLNLFKHNMPLQLCRHHILSTCFSIDCL